MGRLKLMNRIHYGSQREYPRDSKVVRVEVFKRKELFVSREERRGSKISTFTGSVRDLVQEVLRIHERLRSEGVFVIIEVSPSPPHEEIGTGWTPLSDGEREEFISGYRKAKG